MEEHIKEIEKLIAVNKAVTERTPFLDVAAGALQTAVENTRQHEAALAKEQNKHDVASIAIMAGE